MALTLITSCQKTDVSPIVKPAELVSFKFDIASFTIKDGIFKSLNEDSIFDEFQHVYPALHSVIFTDKDGVAHNPENVGHYASIDTRVFTLPAGVYTITGQSNIVPNSVAGVMSYTIDAQTITITQDTKIVPVTLTPTSWLVLIADPYLLNDTTYGIYGKANEQILDKNWGDIPGEFHSDMLIPYNYDPSYPKAGDYRLRYLYCSMLNDPNLFVTFGLKNTNQVEIPTKDFKAGHIYKIFINRPQTLNIIPGFQADSIKNY